MPDDEALRLLVEHGTFYCPTLSVYIPKTPEEDTDLRRRIVASHRQVFQKAMRMGVKIVFGTDVGAFAHGTNAREFELMVEYGMKPIEAIRFHMSRRTTPPESYASGSRSATIARYETDKHTRPDRHPRHAVSFRARLGPSPGWAIEKATIRSSTILESWLGILGRRRSRGRSISRPLRSIARFQT